MNSPLRNILEKVGCYTEYFGNRLALSNTCTKSFQTSLTTGKIKTRFFVYFRLIIAREVWNAFLMIYDVIPQGLFL